jgi:hypothetical protein
LFINQRKAKREGRLPPSIYKGQTARQVARKLWFELDVVGLLLLSGAICLILIPLNLGASAKNGWHNASIIAMLVTGFVCLIAFPIWERTPKLAPYPFFPKELFRDRTVVAGVLIGFFYFSKLLKSSIKRCY